MKDELTFNWFTCCHKKHPQAAEAIVGHTFRCGAPFEQSRSQRRSIVSARLPAQAFCSRRDDTLPQPSNAACANAVSTHCIASVRAAATLPSRRGEYDCARPTEQSSATLGLIVSALALEQVYCLLVGTGVEPATARLSVWCSTH